MTRAGLPARFVEVIGHRKIDGALWAGDCLGREQVSHRAERIGETVEKKPGAGIDRRYEPEKCDACSEAPPSRFSRYARVEAVYDTDSGRPEPGDLYWSTWKDDGGACFEGWSNCDGRHLVAVLPNGHHWDVDSRASNCGSPDDREHRCWVRHGDPPKVTVDNQGRSCPAGGGSISVAGWHGFLTDGAFVPA